MLKVSKKQLLLISALFWGIASIDIAFSGITNWTKNTSNIYLELIGLVAVIMFFAAFIFKRVYHKDSNRILSLDDTRHSVFKIMDIKGWTIVACMITFGVSIRVFGLMPDIAIGVFYSGLAFSLFYNGVRFFRCYLQFLRYQSIS